MNWESHMTNRFFRQGSRGTRERTAMPGCDATWEEMDDRCQTQYSEKGKEKKRLFDFRTTETYIDTLVTRPKA